MRGVLFDLDETLLDRRGSLDAYARTLHADFSTSAKSGFEQFLREFHAADGNGRVPREQFALALAGRCFEGDVGADLLAHYQENAWRALRPFDGALRMLERLRADDWRLGIVTNGSVRSQTNKLRHSGLLDIVHHVVISEAVGIRKPEPAIFKRSVAALGLDISRSWFIGDDPRADIWGAKQCGFRTMWIEHRATWPDDVPQSYDVKLASVTDCYAQL